jgi:signal transduction histidine kinase
VDLGKVAAYLENRNILRYLAGIREAGERAAAIVHGMLGFSRKNGQDKEMADVAALVADSLALAAQENALDRGDEFTRIAIVTDLAPDLPRAPCAPAQIRQVLLNLLRNAVQALVAARTPDPAITVSARREQDHAVIEVADNGPGLPPEYADKAFEPFFTTKKPGEGTGLGLAVSYFLVVENHGGRLEAVSRPGSGAVFAIRLPLSPPPPGP